MQAAFLTQGNRPPRGLAHPHLAALQGEVVLGNELCQQGCFVGARLRHDAWRARACGANRQHPHPQYACTRARTFRALRGASPAAAPSPPSAPAHCPPRPWHGRSLRPQHAFAVDVAVFTHKRSVRTIEPCVGTCPCFRLCTFGACARLRAGKERFTVAFFALLAFQYAAELAQDRLREGTCHGQNTTASVRRRRVLRQTPSTPNVRSCDSACVRERMKIEQRGEPLTEEFILCQPLAEFHNVRPSALARRLSRT